MATISSHTAIQQLYVQYFDRPADTAGLQYWETVVENAHGSTTAVAQAFAGSAEYKASVAGADNAHIVAAVYQNMFGHQPDAAGLSYWADALTRGLVTIDGVVSAVVGGAQGSDLHAYINKVSAALAYTASLDTADKILAYGAPSGALAGKIFLAGVTDDASLSSSLAVLAGTQPPVVAHAPIAADPVTLVGIAPAHEALAHLM